MKEYDKFEKGAANSNTSTVELKKHIADQEKKFLLPQYKNLAGLLKTTKDYLFLTNATGRSLAICTPK